MMYKKFVIHFSPSDGGDERFFVYSPLLMIHARTIFSSQPFNEANSQKGPKEARYLFHAKRFSALVLFLRARN